MTYKYLKTKQVNETLWVEINNPPVNFLNVAILEELHTLVKKVSKDNSIRVFVLTGERDDVYIMHFSIPELLTMETHLKRLLFHVVVKFKITSALLKYYMTFNSWLMDLFPWYEWLVLKQARLIRSFSAGTFLWLQMTRLYSAIDRMNKITIAAINGPCNGGGTELATCFDFRFMIGDQGFTIGQPECLVNIIPGGGGTQRLPRLIGKAKALELMIRGNRLTPQESKQIGLITDVFDKKEFKSKVQEFADNMSKRPPMAIDAIKKSVLLGMNTSFNHGLSIELEQSIRCFGTKDTKMTLTNYIKYLEENIDMLDSENMTTEELVYVVKKSIDVIENASIFEPFEGK